MTKVDMKDISIFHRAQTQKENQRWDEEDNESSVLGVKEKEEQVEETKQAAEDAKQAAE